MLATGWFGRLRPQGTVSIVDNEGRYFSRIWCGFEVFSSLMHDRLDLPKDYRHDFYTVKRHAGRKAHDAHSKGSVSVPLSTPRLECVDQPMREAVGITDGIARSDHDAWGRHSLNKVYREFHFPEEVLANALDVQVSKGKSTLEADRVHILNSLVGRSVSAMEMELDPLLTHPVYQEVDGLLRGKMAAASVRRGIEVGGATTQKYLDCISASQLRELHGYFDSCPEFTAELAALFFDRLPATLEVLSLSCEDHAATETLLGPLTQLKELTTLNLADWYVGPANAGELGAALVGLPKLTALNLYCNGIAPEGAAALAPHLGQLVQLEKLMLEDNSLGPTGTASLAPAIGRLVNLDYLNLYRNDIQAGGATPLAAAVGKLDKLKTLILRSNALGDVGAKALAVGLESCLGMEVLNLGNNDFSAEAVVALLPAIAKMSKLKTLVLDGSACHPLGADVSLLLLVLPRLANLALLKITSRNEIPEATLERIKAAVPEGCVVK